MPIVNPYGGKQFGILALLFGVVSFFFGMIPLLGIVLSIIAIVFGAIGMGRENSNLSTWGLMLGVLSLLIFGMIQLSILGLLFV